MGTLTKCSEPLTPDKESLLWACGQLGTHNAKTLLNTVYYYNCKIFGLRSHEERRRLQCSQHEKKADKKSRVYLQYTDYGRWSQTYQYENVKDEEHCVVNIFVNYYNIYQGMTSTSTTDYYLIVVLEYLDSEVSL